MNGKHVEADRIFSNPYVHILRSTRSLTMLKPAQIERLQSFGHKAVVSSLLFLSAWGLAFCGTGFTDIFMRAQEVKKLKAAAAAADKPS